jgi:hypothetical protein
MSTRADTLPMPDPANYCTVRYAAAYLKRDERTIRAWIYRGILAGYSPRVAANEESRTMLWVAEVVALGEALERARGTSAARTARVGE